jgi:hypothetical protein
MFCLVSSKWINRPPFPSGGGGDIFSSCGLKFLGCKINLMISFCLGDIDGHFFSKSKRRLPFIVCRPRKTNFRFRFCLQQTNGSLPFPFSVSSVYHTYTYMYIYTYGKRKYINIIYIYWYTYTRFHTENGSPYTVYSSCKRKLSVCKLTKRTWEYGYIMVHEPELVLTRGFFRSCISSVKFKGLSPLLRSDLSKKVGNWRPLVQGRKHLVGGSY